MKKEEITLKNTKTEILDALNAALEREKSMANVKYEPEKEEMRKQKEKAIEITKDNVEQKIFSEELNNKFKSLEIAIEAEEEKLKELYGVEKELCNLVVVINAGKDYIADVENKKKEKTEKFNEAVNQLEEEYRNKKDELTKEYEAKTRELKIAREREIEEYNYKIKREREISNNKWEDEKTERENKLNEKEIETNKLLEEAQGKVEYLKELEEKVNTIPELLEKEYAKGRKEATTEIEKENKYNVELLKKDYQNTIDRKKERVEEIKTRKC